MDGYAYREAQDGDDTITYHGSCAPPNRKGWEGAVVHVGSIEDIPMFVEPGETRCRKCGQPLCTIGEPFADLMEEGTPC